MTTLPDSSLESYERRIGRWSRRAAERFVEWLDVDTGRRWLDVGTGTGALAAAVSTGTAPSVLAAIDVSVNSLRHGRARGRDGGATHAVANAMALPFRPGSFDATVSALCLNQLADPAAAVSEMARAARPGGTVAAYVWDFGGQMQPLRLFWDGAIDVDPAAAARDQAAIFPLCNLDRLATLFSGSGLRHVSTHAIDVAARFEDFEDLWEPLVTGSGMVADYARSLEAPRLHAIHDRLVERVSPGSDGSIELVARALAVRGLVQPPD